MGATTEPTLVRVTLVLCSECLRGAGGECHVPGCALWMNRAPDIPLADNCESFVPLPAQGARRHTHPRDRCPECGVAPGQLHMTECPRW